MERERECDKCIHHTSGMCSSWECKMQTVEDVKREAVKEFAEAVLAELEAKRKGYEESATVYNGTHGSGVRLNYALKQGAILEAMEIVRKHGKVE